MFLLVVEVEAITLSFNSATREIHGRLKRSYLTLATWLASELRTLDLAFDDLEQSGAFVQKLPPAAEFKEKQPLRPRIPRWEPGNFCHSSLISNRILEVQQDSMGTFSTASAELVLLPLKSKKMKTAVLTWSLVLVV
ncbi:hypothetical protein Tco_0155269 [Tanacetum coccineum]